jgi:hypothetical protein
MFAGREPAGGLDRVLDSIPPAAGAEVMGTGIVSAALSLDGDETLSRTLLVIAAAMWVTLARSCRCAPAAIGSGSSPTSRAVARAP